MSNSPNDNGDGVIIRDGIPRELAADALAMSYDAFESKFRVGFDNADQFVKLFHDQVHVENCIVATVQGAVAGILTIETSTQSFYNFSLRRLYGRFNPVRASRMLINMLVFGIGSSTEPDEFVVDTLVVDASHRGLGIGTELLNRAELKAVELGKRRMTLAVIDENPRAKQLYERVGFRHVGTTNVEPLQALVGTRAVHKMEKVLAKRPLASP